MSSRHPGFLLRLGDLPGVVERAVADLELPSGQIIACDPLVFLDDAAPFTREVLPGCYPITLGMSFNDVLYARIDFGGRAVRWKVALCPGETDDDVPGYPVDAGTGCFVDAATVEAYLDEVDRRCKEVSKRLADMRIDPNEDLAAWREATERISAEIKPFGDLVDQLYKAGYEKNRHAAISLPGAAKGNLVAFPSGAGDGCYPSYWGLRSDDQPACLVTDFRLLDDDDDDEIEETERTDGQVAETDKAPDASVVAMVEQLVQRGQIELDAPVERVASVVEEALRRSFESLSGATRVAEDILDALVSCDGVREVFAGPDDVLDLLK